MNSEDIPLWAHELRLLVLMENEEWTGFSQVLLNKEQFKKVSDAILKESKLDPTLKPGYEMGVFDLKDDVVIPSEHFEGMESIWYDTENGHA